MPSSSLSLELLPALLAAPIGALCALVWTAGTLAHRLALFGVGCAASHYAAPLTARLLNIAEAPAGFFLGLVSVAVIDKVFTVWRRLEFDSLLEAVVERFLGLKWRTKAGEPVAPPDVVLEARPPLPYLPIPKPRLPVEESLEENDPLRQPYLVQDRVPQQLMGRHELVFTDDGSDFPTLPPPSRLVTVSRRVYGEDHHQDHYPDREPVYGHEGQDE